jgi:hypothetical protein
MSTRFLERLLALFGALACLVIVILIWQVVSAQQPMWPLPGLYLIQVVAVSIAGMFGALRGDSSGGAVIWAVVGVFIAFVVLGGFSIGPSFIPVVLAFALAGILLDIRLRRSILIELAVCVAAGVAQTALMLALIQFI